MATLDEVYCKFGEAAEAAQLLETQLGTLLFGLNAQDQNLFENRCPEKAAEILRNVNRSTLGNLLKRLKKTTDFLDVLESQLILALAERNRLAHDFYRQHNLRKNSSAGRDIMLKDLEKIHINLLNAYVELMLLEGIDLRAVVAASSHLPDSNNDAELPSYHLPI